MKKLLFVILAIVSIANAGDLKVAAAANTTYAFEKIKSEFKKIYPDINLEVSLSSSGKLNAQIKNGAPFDIFMAANMKFTQDLYDHGFATTKPVIYAKGKLALLSVRGFDVKKGLDILKNPAIKTISIANPTTAPYGSASVEAMKKSGIYNEVSKKLVQAGNIGNALSQTLSATDIGFIAASAMFDSKMTKYKNDYILVDTKLYKPINQGIVILKNGKNSKEAKEFYDFILSKSGKKIFKEYGYGF